MARMIVCKECQLLKAHEGRGLCRNCYAKVARAGRLELFPQVGRGGRTIVTCSGCNEQKELEANGLCRNCYAKLNWHKNKKNENLITCFFCKKVKQYFSKEMCKACYVRSWRNNGIPTEKRKRPKKAGTCIDCGVLGNFRAKDRCRKCYTQYHRENNPELYKAYDAKYKKLPEHKESALRHKRLRRHKIKGLPATLTEQEWQEILKRYDYRCAYCRKKEDKPHREHWVPLAKGGGYTADNIVPACKRCNARKGTMTGDEFLAILQKEKEGNARQDDPARNRTR